MKRVKTVDRKTVLRAMMELAEAPANDAVMLAFLGEDSRADIEQLNLGCLTEFKRSGNGTVEIRLADRAGALAKLLEQLKEEESAGPAAFLQALERTEPPEKEERVCSRR